MKSSTITRLMATGAGLVCTSALFAAPPVATPITKKTTDLAIQSITLNPQCEVTVTLANSGSAVIPDSAYQSPGTILQSMTKSGPWGGAALYAMDPARKLKQPGAKVSYSVFKRPLKPGESLRISMTLKPGGYRDSNGGNNRMAQLLRCPGRPGVATANGRLPALAGPSGSHIPQEPLTPLFRITKEQLLTYTFPGSNRFHVDLQGNMPFNPASVPPGRLRVHARRYDGAQMTWSGLVPGSISVSGTWLRWDSEPGPLAASCTSTPQARCVLEFILFDGVLSSSGERLDGDGNGTPGGNYRHVFERGMP